MKKKFEGPDTLNEDIWADFENIPTVEELAKNSEPVDLDGDPEFVAGYLKAQFVEDIYQTLKAQGINKNKLAEKMGKSPQYVGKILNERANFTLETLAVIACSLGVNVVARMYPKDKRMEILPIVARPYIIDLDLEGFLPEKKTIDAELGEENAGDLAA